MLVNLQELFISRLSDIDYSTYIDNNSNESLKDIFMEFFPEDYQDLYDGYGEDNVLLIFFKVFEDWEKKNSYCFFF